MVGLIKIFEKYFDENIFLDRVQSILHPPIVLRKIQIRNNCFILVETVIEWESEYQTSRYKQIRTFSWLAFKSGLAGR